MDAGYAARTSTGIGRESLGASGEADDQGFQAVVISEHRSDDELQLSLRVGDIVYVLEDDDSGWAGGYRLGDEDVTGWFPRVCVRPCGQAEPEKTQAVITAVPCLSEKQQASTRPISFSGSEAAAMMTSTDSPTRQIRAIATPHAARQSRETDSETNKLKEQLRESESKVVTLTEELSTEKAHRQRLERDLEQQNRQTDRQLQDLRVQLDNATASKKGAEEMNQKQEVRLRRTEGCNQELQAQISALQSELAKKNTMLESLNARLKDEEEQRQKAEREAEVLVAEQRKTEHVPMNAALGPRELEAVSPKMSRPAVADPPRPAPAVSTPKSFSHALIWNSPEPSKGATEVRGRALFSEPPKANVTDDDVPRPGSVQAQIRALERRATTTQLQARSLTPKRLDSSRSGSARWMKGSESASPSPAAGLPPVMKTNASETALDAGVKRAPLETQHVRTAPVFVAPPLDVAAADEESEDAPAFGLSPISRGAPRSSA